jgi:dipeptidyl aminopeptidase/acylaminoacyl peptidase
MRFLTLFLLVPTLLPAQNPKRKLTLDDQHKFKQVGAPQCSPDGKWVAYTVSTTDPKADKRDSDVWMVSFDGKENLRVTSSSESESSPKWSPDGRYLSFLSSRQGPDPKVKGAQVWLLDRRGGEAQQLTNVAGRISDYEWSPDSKSLALIVTDKEEDKDKKEGAEKEGDKPKPIVIDRYQFKRDGRGYLFGPRAKINFFEIATKKLEPLNKDPYDESQPTFSPDGKWIAFVSARRPDAERSNNSDVYIAEAKPGGAIKQLTTWEGSDGGNLEFSRDGKYVLYTQGPKAALGAYGMNRLYRVSVEGGEPLLLTGALDRGVSNPVLTTDGESVDFLVTDDRSVYPARVPLRSGAIERLLGGPRVVMGLNRSAGCTAMLMTTDTTTPEVYVLEGKTPRKLTGHNDALLAELELAPTEEIAFKAKDGNEPHALLVKPVGFEAGKKYPMLLWIHGGPNAQDQHSFAFERQFFAAHGYLVLAINYRGSSGRGQDYTKAISADWGNKEVIDLLAGVDHVVNLGLADPDRLGVGGWSYGGILTDYVIATTTRFKAAASGAGTAFTVSYYGTDHYILQYDNEIGPPWKAWDTYVKISYPFLHADRIKTPTLFMCGEKDFNVPVAGSEQMYQALKSLGIEAQLIVYPGEFHGIARPSFQRDRMQRYLDWFNKFLMPAPAKPTN